MARRHGSMFCYNGSNPLHRKKARFIFRQTDSKVVRHMGGRPSSPASGKDRVVTGVVAGVSALTVMLVLVLLLLGPGRGHGLADGGDGVHIGDALDPIIAEKGTENEGATVETMAEPAAGTVSEPAAEPAEEPAAEPAAEPAQSIALPLQ